MNRPGRIAIGIVAPPIFGSIAIVLVFLALGFESGKSLLEQAISIFSDFYLTLILAFLFVGLQAIACTLFVEFYLRSKRLQHYFFLLICFGLGVLSGLVPGMLLDLVLVFSVVGGIVGTLVGLMIYPKDYEFDKNRA